MVRFVEEDITPEKADKWLATHNIMNREMTEYTVLKYKKMMENDLWVPDNGEPMVIFDTKGVISDGQQRLEALRRSGLTIRGWVAYDANPMGRATIDEGRKRLFKDDLSMLGVRNSYPMSALLRKILCWERDGGLKFIPSATWPRPEMNARWPEFAHEIVDTVQMTSKWVSRWPGNKGSMMFMYWLLRFHDLQSPRMVDRFFQTITAGSQQTEDGPLNQIRDKLDLKGSYRQPDEEAEGQHHKIHFEVFFLIEAWNAWVLGKKPKYSVKTKALSNPYQSREVIED